MKWFTFSQVGRGVPLTALSLLLLPIASSLSAQQHEKNAPVKHRLILVGGTFYSARFQGSGLLSRFQSHDLGTLHRSAFCQIDSG
jgi:hypothetical protein